jgi:uncharacterized damage-inducible protein DinB
MAAFRLQFVFDQERHHLGQAHRLLFGVSKTSDIFTLFGIFLVIFML